MRRVVGMVSLVREIVVVVVVGVDSAMSKRYATRRSCV